MDIPAVGAKRSALNTLLTGGAADVVAGRVAGEPHPRRCLVTSRASQEGPTADDQDKHIEGARPGYAHRLARFPSPGVVLSPRRLWRPMPGAFFSSLLESREHPDAAADVGMFPAIT